MIIGYLMFGQISDIEDASERIQTIRNLCRANGAAVEISDEDIRIIAFKSQKQIYTDMNDAFRFVQQTGIDALACWFGTAHGLYLKAPRLDMSVLDRVKAKVDIPLVMHGGSGASELDYRAAIAKGIRKVNYYTYMAKAGGEEVVRKYGKTMAT